MGNCTVPLFQIFRGAGSRKSSPCLLPFFNPLWQLHSTLFQIFRGAGSRKSSPCLLFLIRLRDPRLCIPRFHDTVYFGKKFTHLETGQLRATTPVDRPDNRRNGARRLNLISRLLPQRTAHMTCMLGRGDRSKYNTGPKTFFGQWIRDLQPRRYIATAEPEAAAYSG